MMKKVSMAMTVLIAVALLMALAVPVSAGELGKININKADRDQLMLLDGIGESYAERIIAYREANGPFKSPEDLLQIKGIGPRTLEKNKGRILVTDE